MSFGYPPYNPPGTGSNTNPDGTVPLPTPATVPVPGWASADTVLSWVDGTAPVLRTASWSSPVFDLRPEFRSGLRTGQSSTSAGTQAIWRPQGAGGQLFVHVLLPTSLATLFLTQVYSSQRAHPSDPTKVRVIEPDQSVGMVFVAGQAAVELTFTPPGEGYPIRYWQQTLRFDAMAAHEDAVITISAAYY